MSEELPILYTKITALYDKLVEGSVDGVYTGNIGRTYVEATGGTSLQTKAFHFLIEMGCIERTQKGNSAHPTIARILSDHPPTLIKFREVYVRKDLTRRHSIDILSQEVNDLKGRLPDIDVTRWILSFEQRLTDLEAKLREE